MRRQFTFLGSLITLTLVLLVIGIVLSLISQMRVAAHRATSLDNLRQIGTAIQNFESNFDKLPMLCDYGAGAPTQQGLCSLFYAILPYIESRSIYPGPGDPRAYYDMDKGEAKEVYKFYISPADPSTANGAINTSDITGVTPSFTGWYATTSYAANGMVFQPEASRKSISDGLAQTIMIAERYQICKLGSNGQSPQASVPDVYTMWGLGAYSNSTAAFALAVPEGNNVPVATPANQMFVPKDSQNRLIQGEGFWASSPTSTIKYTADLIAGAPGGFQVAPRGSVICDARVPQTPHPGGMLVCMADLSTRTIAGNISSLIFWSAVTPKGNEILGNDW
jgi:hypothetical protein